ncbi:hypothetical protein H6P81_013024 [Aristolochia fimbriata]|uniref:Peroxisomal membrane protein PMP22 n=1 Tax=Aristolochia fimbriata TaxID=158543 RepID=A0AAV7EGM3_ARIFI|nr:hypothetical protein H6P81_013024 [Aristolochia fimbriata]
MRDPPIPAISVQQEKNPNCIRRQISSRLQLRVCVHFHPSLDSFLQSRETADLQIRAMSEVVGEVWRKYLLQLQLHPLRTKAITAGVLAGCSDAVAQKISGVKKLQPRRLLLLMLYGFAYGGPFGHFLHKLMDIIFKGKKDKLTVLKKVLLEQLTSSPWNNMFFLMYYGLVVEGRSWGVVKGKLRKDWPLVQLAAWRFWPIVGWVNYQYMPLQFRVLFHSLVACCWGIFLNLKARSLAGKDA